MAAVSAAAEAVTDAALNRRALVMTAILLPTFAAILGAQP
jgi:hypothetical protein